MNNIKKDEENDKKDTKQYSFYHKKKLAYRIEKIKTKKNYLKLFKIINEDSNKYTTNSNGVFFNMNSLKNSTIDKIEEFLDELDKSNEINNLANSIDTEFTPYSIDDFSDYKPIGPKLSNHEKKILKRNNYKKKDSNIIYRNYSQN